MSSRNRYLITLTNCVFIGKKERFDKKILEGKIRIGKGGVFQTLGFLFDDKSTVQLSYSE